LRDFARTGILAVKRTIDTLIVIALAPLWIALLALCALCVFVAMGRPVFFRQERIGLGCRPFTILKLRTMRMGEGTDAERITPFGAFLRRTSLDELPQLLNVLRGDMSLVGPRPLPSAYLPLYSDEQRRRHEVRPGITGWAQVNGRNGISWERRFELDVWYVDHRSLLLDARIAVMTIAAVFTARGVSADGEATVKPFTGSARVAPMD
jgi:lipopolysaccharide/colanic/teichoic acid biosynthesis glycosyltransferase